MTTKFPGAFDDVSTLGGSFINDVPPADPNINIDAAFRNNVNDALLAMQHRIGVTDDVNPLSLSWATISSGGVGNLGLRFAQPQTEWPGEVAESGIFFKDGSLEPVFHRAGEPKATFYPMLGSGGTGTLQQTYDTGSTITTSAGSGNLVFTIPTATVADFVLQDDGADEYIRTIGATKELNLGSASVKVNIAGDANSNVVFDGTQPYSLTNADDLAVSATAGGTLNISGDAAVQLQSNGAVAVTSNAPVTFNTDALVLDPATDQAAINTAVFDANSALTIKSTGVNNAKVMSLENAEAVPSQAEFYVTNLDPNAAITASKGSVALLTSGSGGVYYNTDGATAWTQLGTGGASTLQDAYDAGSSIVMAAGIGLSLSGNGNFNFTTNSNRYLLVEASSNPRTTADPPFIVDTTLTAGIDGAYAASFKLKNPATNDDKSLGAVWGSIDSEGDLTTPLAVISAFEGDVSFAGAGAVGALPSLVASFYASTASSVPSVGTTYSAGLVVSDQYDLGIVALSATSLFRWKNTSEAVIFDCSHQTDGLNGSMIHTLFRSGNKNSRALDVEGGLGDNTAGGDGLGGTLVSCRFTSDSPPANLLAGAEAVNYYSKHTLHDLDSPTAVTRAYWSEFIFPSTGGPGDVANQGPSAYGLYVDMPETYNASVYENNTGTYSFFRWALWVQQGESHLRHTEFTCAPDTNKPLIKLDQQDPNYAFIQFKGALGGFPGSNLTQYNGGAGGDVPALQAPAIGGVNLGYVHWGMIRVTVHDGVTETDVWIRAYELKTT